MSDVFFADRILFVEGPSEKEIIPILAEKLGIDLIEHGIEILPMRGKDKGKYHIKMWSEISKNTQLPTYFLFDGDAKKEVKEALEEGFLSKGNSHVLSVQDFEDLYPMPILENIIKTIVKNVEGSLEPLKKVDLKPPRKKKLESLLGEDGLNIPGWKTVVGKQVVKNMRKDDFIKYMGEIREALDELIER